MHRSAASWILVVACAVALVGCDDPPGDEPGAVQTSPGPGAPPGPGPSTAPGSRCPNHERALESGDVLGGKVGGDVDGDGSRDTVYLLRDDGGDPDCRTFLVAQTGGGLLATPTNEEGAEHALEAPRIHSFVQVDGDGGEEILVDLEHGASTQFLAMFTVAEGNLRRVEIAEQTEFGSLFPHGGSVGHIEASNCSDEPGADVVITLAMANATDYTIRSRLYELVGAKLEPLPPNSQPDIRIGAGVAEMEGAQTSPFGDCSRAS